MAHSHDGAAAPRPDGRRDTSHPSSPSAAVLTPPTGLPAVEPAAAAPEIPRQRIPAEPVTPPPAGPDVQLCTCGHPEEMHEHYRPGTDCGSCGARGCDSFRPADVAPTRNPLRKLLRRRG